MMEFFRLPEVRSSWPKSMSKLGTDKVAQNGFETVLNEIQNYSIGDSEKTAERCFFPLLTIFSCTFVVVEGRTRLSQLS